MLKRRFRWLIITFLALIFTLPLSVMADFDPAPWAYRKEIIPPANMTRDNFVELAFDAEIIANSRHDLADLRIIRGDGLEIPYLHQLDVPVRLIEQNYLGEEATIITADLGTTVIYHNGLTLTTSSSSIEREIKIENSNDNKTWVEIESTLESKTINYSATSSRYLRITIYDRGEKRLIIAGALAHQPVTFFRYEPTHTYQLYFGQVEASQPEYDLAMFPDDIGKAKRPKLTLGAKEDNPQYLQPVSPRTSPFDRYPYLLLGMIVLITAGVIGGLAYRLFKQTQV